MLDGNDNCVAKANITQDDADGDAIGDACDNCTALANANQRDTNGDDYGNQCDADLNGDGLVNFGDFAIMKSKFFGAPGPSGLVP